VKRERQFPEASKPSTSQKSMPLDGINIFIIGKPKLPKDITKRIQELGGSVVSKIDSSVQLCISTKAEVEKKSKNITKASSLDIHIVSIDFLDAVKNGGALAHSVKENMIAEWGGDTILKFGIKKEKKAQNSKVEEKLEKTYKSVPQKMKIKVGGAAAVDPDSGLEETAHVYQKKDAIYKS